MRKGLNTYREINTMGMSQVDLILTVYRGAIGFVESATTAFEAGKTAEGQAACERIRRCLVHLYTTLDMEKGQAIAAKLGQLYAYMIEQLDLAAASGSTKILGDVARMLTTIKEGWESLKESENGMAASGLSANGAEDDVRPDDEPGPGSRKSNERITISA
jgi:flagellar protein FliS